MLAELPLQTDEHAEKECTPMSMQRSRCARVTVRALKVSNRAANRRSMKELATTSSNRFEIRMPIGGFLDVDPRPGRAPLSREDRAITMTGCRGAGPGYTRA
jgi:hypothetical protein